MVTNRITGKNADESAKKTVSKSKSEVVEDSATMDKPVFAIDLGNHQAKLKSGKGEYIYSSSYIDTKKLPKSGFGETIEGNETYRMANERSSFVWGDNLEAYNRPEDMIDTYSRTNRFGKKNAKRLLEFALAKLALDFPESTERVLSVRVVLGVPIRDFNKNNSTIETLKEIVIGTHVVSVDDVEVMVKVESDADFAVVPQFMGTATHLALNEEGVKDIDFIKGNHAIFDMGGGTILANIVSNLSPNPDGVEKFVGAEVLVKSIMDAQGVTRSTVVKEMLREGSVEDGFIYRPTNNEKDNIVMTDVVSEEIEDYTRNTVASFITSAFSDVETFDNIIMTGGGINLIDVDALEEEVGEELFGKMIFVEDSELANVRGFYKIKHLLPNW